jgi:hypothetical protein
LRKCACRAADDRAAIAAIINGHTTGVVDVNTGEDGRGNAAAMPEVALLASNDGPCLGVRNAAAAASQDTGLHVTATIHKSNFTLLSPGGRTNLDHQRNGKTAQPRRDFDPYRGSSEINENWITSNRFNMIFYVVSMC